MSTRGKVLPSRAVSLIGQRFGKLVVVERAANSPNGNARWSCVCDCGSKTTSFGSDLRRHRTTTCGCGANQATRNRHAVKRDLVGKRFGRLTVIEFAGLNSYPRSTWRCRCDCGEQVVVTGHHLAGKETVSCGCRRREVLALRPTWMIKEEVGYVAAHGRVKSLHGPASRHLCVDCLNPAEDWSYDHEDLDERCDVRGRPYSMDPLHYSPRCRTCHKSFDSVANRAGSEIATEGARE